MNELEKRMSERKKNSFKPKLNYFSHGDYATFYLKDELAYAEQIDSNLMVYRSVKTKEVIGFKISGCRLIGKPPTSEVGHYLGSSPSSPTSENLDKSRAG